MREYCRSYFQALTVTLALVKRRPAPETLAVLGSVVGFETFAIGTRAHGTVAAGTSTLRNPAYLLARLRWPRGRDNPAYLPATCPFSDQTARVFLHYRQLRLAKDSPMSVLVYLAADLAERASSYAAIAEFEDAIGAGGDPFARERARRLWARVLEPSLLALGTDPLDVRELEFLDVGGGSGALVSALAGEFATAAGRVGLDPPQVRFWSVDLNPARSKRASGFRALSRVFDSLMLVKRDYRAWLDEENALPKGTGLRIAVLAKLLHSASHVQVDRVRTDVLQRGSEAGSSAIDVHDPVACLAPGGGGPKNLSVGATSVRARHGRWYLQRSLAAFHEALAIVRDARIAEQPEGMESAVSIRFNPESLLTSSGRSVIEVLANRCDLVLIEDRDLAPDLLTQHLRSLPQLAAFDFTRSLGLRGNYAYLVARADQLSGAPGGRRL